MDRLRVAALAVGLVIATGAVYARVGGFDFVQMDDPTNVTSPGMMQGGLTLESVKWAFASIHVCNWLPVTTLTYLAESSLFGVESARPYHLTNVALHAAGTVVLFLVLTSMTGAAYRSAFVAALFALHPLHVESVAWVSERKDVLSALMSFLTIAAYVAFVRRGGAWRYLLVLGAYALALMSKPMVVTLPFVLLLLDFWPLRRLKGARVVIEKVPLLAMAAALSVVTAVVQRDCGAMMSVERLPLSLRAANAWIAYVRYIGDMFWPGKLIVLYPLETTALRLWPVALLLLVAVTVAAAVLWRRCPYLVVGWLWYLGMLVPVIGLVQVGQQSRADRYTYLPLIGLFIMLAWGVSDWVMSRPRGRAILPAGAAVILALCAILTVKQLSYWRNDLTLLGHALEVFPNSGEMQARYADSLREAGKMDDALPYYRRALELAPESWNVWCNVGVFLSDRGDDKEAELAFGRSIKLIEAARAQGYDTEAQSAYRVACRNLGAVLMKQKNYSAAEEPLRKVIAVDPTDPQTQTTLADLLISTGREGEAIKHYRQAAALDPRSVATNNLAWILATSDDPGRRDGAEAVRLAKAWCAVAGDDAEALDTLAAAYAEAGDFARAIATASRAFDKATLSGQSALAAELQHRIAMYRQSRPYREVRARP